VEDFPSNLGTLQMSIKTQKLLIIAGKFDFQGSQLALGDPQILSGSFPV
jgi:hypothetical protein